MAIANRRLIAFDERGVTFKWKDYRTKGRERYKTMTLATDEFIRRFLIHVLPGRLHRIRYYGLFANKGRTRYLARVRRLLQVPPDISEDPTDDASATPSVYVCKACGASMIIIEILSPDHPARAPPIRPP